MLDIKKKRDNSNEKSVLKSITVISLFDEIKFKNYKNTIDLEMRLIENSERKRNVKCILISTVTITCGFYYFKLSYF